MVEEDAGAGKHVVCLAVFLDDPEAVELGDGVGAVGMEGGLLVLRNLLHLAVKLGRGGLVEPAGLGKSALAYALEQTKHAGGVDVGGELRGVEADLHVALGSEVVDLVGFHLVEHLDDRHRVAEVGIMKMEVRMTLKMGDALAEVHGGTADSAVHVITFLKKQFGKERAVLTRDACDKSFFHIVWGF